MQSSRRRTLVERLKSMWQRFRRKSPPPGDPYAERLVPIRRGPKGRSGAAAVEFEEDSYRAFPPRNR